jgi:hypothetical protein
MYTANLLLKILLLLGDCQAIFYRVIQLIF